MKNILTALLVAVSGACGNAGVENAGKNISVLQNEALSCAFDAGKHTFVVTDKRTNRIWTSVAPKTGVELISCEQQNPNTLVLKLQDKPTGAEFVCVVRLGPGAILDFELQPSEKDFWPGALNEYPPALVTKDPKPAELIFCDRSGGVLLDQTDKLYSDKTLGVFSAFGGLSMPWIGTILRDGQGMMTLFETPWDAGIALREDDGGRLWPHVKWEPSQNAFNYPRKVSYRFYPSGGYLAMAKAYRQYVVENGRFKSLKQKAEARPRVNWIKGAPVIWGWQKHYAFFKEAYNHGIRRAILSGVSPETPDLKKEDFIRMTDAGWLVGCYDSYTDIIEGPRGRQKDNIEESATRNKPGSGPLKAWLAEDGVQYYSRSSALALDAAKSYTPADLEKFAHTTRFIDVSAAIDLFEDYHPKHTFGRRGDMENRRELYKYFNDLGLVVRAEFGNDWACDIVDLFEGGMSYCPLLFPSTKYLKFPKKEEIDGTYRYYSMGYEVRIPLWELVYHDSVANTWWWGDTAGFLYPVAPDMSDRKDLFNLLYGTLPLLWFNENDFGWDRNRGRFLKTFQDTCLFNEVVAFDEMLSHEFLTGDRTLQRTKFSSGAEVVVNFAETPQPYDDGGHEVMLAPRGFFVKSKDLEQSRLWIDNEPVTLIRKSGYLVVETASQRQVGPVNLNGRMAAFKVDDKRWNLILQPGREYSLDMNALTGWGGDAHYKLMTTTGTGELVLPLEAKVAGSTASFKAEPGKNLVAVVRE